MPRAKIEGLQKHTLCLFEGDYAKLQLMFPDLGAAHVIRTIVRSYITLKQPPFDASKMKEPIDV